MYDCQSKKKIIHIFKSEIQKNPGKDKLIYPGILLFSSFMPAYGRCYRIHRCKLSDEQAIKELKHHFKLSKRFKRMKIITKSREILNGVKNLSVEM